MSDFVWHEAPPEVAEKFGYRRCIYFSSPIFSQYNDNAPLWCFVPGLRLTAVHVRPIDMVAPLLCSKGCTRK